MKTLQLSIIATAGIIAIGITSFAIIFQPNSVLKDDRGFISENYTSSIPKEVREKIPEDIELITDASDYNLSVKLYHGMSDTKEDVLLLLLQNRISEPIMVKLARVNVLKSIDIDSQQIFDYNIVGDGYPNPRMMTPYYGESYEIKPNSSLSAVLIGSFNLDGLIAEARYYIKNEQTELQSISYSVTTPTYDPSTKSTKPVDDEWAYPNLNIGFDMPPLPADYAYMYVYMSGLRDQATVAKIREDINSMVESSNDIIIYHVTASRSAKILGTFNHFPVVNILKNLPDEVQVSYIFVIVKHKPDDKMLIQIHEIMEASSYSLRGSGEGMFIRID